MALTPEQIAVTQHREGHAKVIAVAGAGKTTTLLHLIVNRINDGTDPKRILVLMYNRSTQRDFQKRLQHLCPQNTHASIPGHDTATVVMPEIRTFHSLGLRIYKRLIQQGLLPPFQEKLISSAEMEQQLWRLLQQLADKETKQDILDNKKKWIEPALAFIERVKSGLQSPEAVFSEMGLPTKCRLFLQAFAAFEQWRKTHQRISYSDMLYDPCCLFLHRADIAEQFSGHMQYILVDEYQDINEIQQYLLDILLTKRGFLIAIGDPDQTIYEFRGSRPEYMLEEFDRRYAYTHYTLSQTFRYGHALALSVNHLISHNHQREDILSTPATNLHETQLHIHSHTNYAKKTIEIIEAARSNTPLEDIAILNRLWAISAPIELALLQARLPYTLENTQSVLQRSELKTFILLFKIARGDTSQWNKDQKYRAFKTLLTTPFPKIKRDTLDQLSKKLADCKNDFGRNLNKLTPTHLSQWQRDQLEGRAGILISAEYGKRSAFELANKYLINTDFYNSLKESAFSAQQIEDKTATVRAFIQYLRSLDISAAMMIDHIAQLEQQRQQQDRPGVCLSSIHKAKGLEWPVVIIPALNDQYYPFLPEKEFAGKSNEESERRLLYVAMTRTINTLHMIKPEDDGQSADTVSPFVQQAAPKLSQFVTKKIQALQDSIAEPGARYQGSLNNKPLTEVSSTNIENSKNDENATRQQVITLPYKNVRIAQRYLKQANIPLRLEGINRYLTQEPSQIAGNEHNKPNLAGDKKAAIQPSSSRAFIHDSLGPGQLVSENNKQWQVRLADGSTKILIKSAASPYIIWMD
jgi:DNA helicase-2/ATP-dependent DNA helicase PcrA